MDFIIYFFAKRKLKKSKIRKQMKSRVGICRKYKMFEVKLHDKYDIAVDENIWIAKRLLVDAVYSSANLEGIAVTFAQTQDILNNVNVSKLTPIEINKVCCLRDAWEYMIEHINDSLDLGYLMNVHEIIARFDVPY